MSEKTEKNLAIAFAAESQASVRNAVFAKKADKEGFLQIARLFRAVSDAESVHANRCLLLLRGKVDSTEENLKKAFEKETSTYTKEYSKFVKDASDEGESGASKAFMQIRNSEKRHAELYQKAMSNMLADSQTDYYVCQICGYIEENRIPNNCPVCGAVRTRFKKISEAR